MTREKKELNISIGDQTKEGFTQEELSVKYKSWHLDSSVTEIFCSNYLQRVPGKMRGIVMDEFWRILKIGGKVTVVVPYWSSMGAVADFAYEWPPINDLSFTYFQKDWREANKSHLELKCDFAISYGYTLDPETALRATEAQVFWIKHYLGSAAGMQLTLTKK